MAIQIKKATREQLKLRMAIDGPTGSGKTYTALRFAFALASDPSKVGVIDTENRSASKYVGEAPDGFPWQFDVVELADCHPQHYIEAIAAFEQAGYEVLVIDSLSHAWEGETGILALHDKATKKSGSGNSWTAWREVTPLHDRLVQAILKSKLHIIATMRTKMEYVQEGSNIKKVGMAPIQRAGIEFEFDIVCDMDWSHALTISKTRCSAIDGKVEHIPGPLFMRPIATWLSTGERPKITPQPAQAPSPTEGGNGHAETSAASVRWQDDPGIVARFRAEAKDLKLDKDPARVLHALGDVAKVSDYQGSYDDAIAALRAAVHQANEAKIDEAVAVTAQP